MVFNNYFEKFHIRNHSISLVNIVNYVIELFIKV